MPSLNLSSSHSQSEHLPPCSHRLADALTAEQLALCASSIGASTYGRSSTSSMPSLPHGTGGGDGTRKIEGGLIVPRIRLLLYTLSPCRFDRPTYERTSSDVVSVPLSTIGRAL